MRRKHTEKITKKENTNRFNILSANRHPRISLIGLLYFLFRKYALTGSPAVPAPGVIAFTKKPAKNTIDKNQSLPLITTERLSSHLTFQTIKLNTQHVNAR